MPFAVFFAVWGASEVGLLRGTLWWVLFWLSLIGLVGGTPTIGAWYRRRFGLVERRGTATP